MSSFLYYPQEPPLDEDVSPSMTALHSNKKYWISIIHLKNGGKMVLKWRRPWDCASGHGYDRAISLDWERHEVNFNNGKFVLWDRNPDE